MAWMQRHACERAARLISRQRDEPLGPWLRLRLGWHLRRCGDCREVERQLALIDALAREALAGEALDGGAQR
jgi:hypothetical protein